MKKVKAKKWNLEEEKEKKRRVGSLKKHSWQKFHLNHFIENKKNVECKRSG